MAIDFPNSPTNGQVFVAPNGVTYIYDATATLWKSQTGNAIIVASDTAPSSPFDGMMWFNTVLGALYLYYNDGNSKQWVPASPVPTVAAVGWRKLGDVVASNQLVLDFTNIPPDINHLMFHVANAVPVTNAVYLLLQFYNASGVLDTGTNYQGQGTLSYNSGAVGNNALIGVANGLGGVIFHYNASGWAISNTAGQGMCVEGKIAGIKNASGRKMFNWQSCYLNDGATAVGNYAGSGSWLNTSAITGLRFSMSGGNISTGLFSLWGSP